MNTQIEITNANAIAIAHTADLSDYYFDSIDTLPAFLASGSTYRVETSEGRRLVTRHIIEGEMVISVFSRQEAGILRISMVFGAVCSVALYEYN